MDETDLISELTCDEDIDKVVGGNKIIYTNAGAQSVESAVLEADDAELLTQTAKKWKELCKQIARENESLRELKKQKNQLTKDLQLLMQKFALGVLDGSETSIVRQQITKTVPLSLKLLTQLIQQYAESGHAVDQVALLDFIVQNIPTKTSEVIVMTKNKNAPDINPQPQPNKSNEPKKPKGRPRKEKDVSST